MNETKIYQDLARHLDRLPVGYPSTESGVEIRLLRHLFTPEEAQIALQLSILPEPLKRIYQRVKKNGITIEKLDEMLDHMTKKGVIAGRNIYKSKGKEKHYSNAMFALGIFDFQVDKITREFMRDFEEYMNSEFYKEFHKDKSPSQMRIIPIERSITPQNYVSIYDDIIKIVEKTEGPISIFNCICRQAKDLFGEKCKQTDLRETCMAFRDAALHTLDLGYGRSIDKKEALEIIRRCHDDGLIVQTENTLNPSFICACCGDCCQILSSVKKFHHPADFCSSNYYVEVNEELCVGCKKCVSRCQMGALVIVNGVSNVDLDFCIGCGNCVPICPSNAIQLQKKSKIISPPKNYVHLYSKILAKKVGVKGLLKLGSKMLLRRKL